MKEWVDVEVDIPLTIAGKKRVSVDIDVLLFDGTIIQDCFCTVDDEEFYDRNGKRIPYKKVKAWRTR